MSSEERRGDYVNLDDRLRSLEVAIAAGFAELGEGHKALGKEIEDLGEVQDRILKCLYGNGREGLVTTVAKVKQKQHWILAMLGGSATIIGAGIVDRFIPFL